MSTEANVLVFGDTRDRGHDLILFVGKEPNNALERTVTIGRYGDDWTGGGTGTSCNFWNRMYSHAGAMVGIHGNTLRRFCARVGASPLAVTDLSPLALDGSYTTAQKKAIRKRISGADFEAHVRGVFSHTALMQRVRLAWMVGHHGSGLDCGIPIFEAACREADVPFVHTAALDSTRHTNTHRLAELGGVAPVVRETVTDFLDAYGDSAAA